MNGNLRRVASFVLTILLAFLLCVTSLGVWAERAALNNDVFAQNAAQILDSQQVQVAISVYVVDEIFDSVPNQSAPGISLVGGLLRGAIERQVARVLGSSKVQNELLQAIVKTHQQAVALVKSESETVLFDLGPVFRSVVQGLIGEKVLPTNGIRNSDLGEVYLYSGDTSVRDKENLEEIRRVVRLVQQGLWISIVLCLVCAAGVLFVATRRVYGFRNFFVSILMASLLGLVALRVVEGYIPNQITQISNRDAAVSILSVMLQGWNRLYIACIAISLVGFIFTVRDGALTRSLSSRMQQK